MNKLLLMSVIFATVLIPVMAARHPSPKQGLRQAILWMFIFNLFYMVAILTIWPRIL